MGSLRLTWLQLTFVEQDEVVGDRSGGLLKGLVSRWGVASKSGIQVSSSWYSGGTVLQLWATSAVRQGSELDVEQMRWAKLSVFNGY